jgi:ABC-type polysaccharide/polyol phosphate transport system ATPase subunit
MAPQAAIDVSHVTKYYRRYSQRRQFSTLKSALLSRTVVRNLAPDQSFLALSDVSFSVPAGAT